MPYTEPNPVAQMQRVVHHLTTLCTELPTRAVGTSGNQAAATSVERTFAAAGWAVERQPFDCIAWEGQGATLTIEKSAYAVHASPWTTAIEATAPLVVCATVEELEKADLRGRIVLLRGGVAAGQLMPRNFRFYNPDEHRRIYAAVEQAAPRAIITATPRDPSLAGAVYPVPMFEDGDFDIPSVFTTEAESERLAAHAGARATLAIRAARTPSTGWNVVARIHPAAERHVVCFAHLDAKQGTPGATDNATGVSTLLLLAELLAGYSGPLGIELVALNGEDNYANPGEIAWLDQNAARADSIVLGVNIDGIGYHKGCTAWSLYQCPAALHATIESILGAHPALIAGEPWYAGDHSLFLLLGVPALALTSELAQEMLATLIHTERDTPAVVDACKVVEAAHALHDVIHALD